MNKAKITTVLFDLDGTLLNTAPDLAYALNQVLAAQQQPVLPYETIRPYASHGAKGLLQLGFQINEQDPRYEALKEQLLAVYYDNIANLTTLFHGVEEMLKELVERQLNWGIVTNKVSRLTEALLANISLPYPPGCVVSGDTVTRAKPYPDSLLHACKLLNCEPQHCLYVGDAERDIQAGNSAGMKTILAHYGYIAPADNTRQWQAAGAIHAPLDLVKYL